MKELAHLNAIQLSAYAEKKLERDEAGEIGRHLLKCAECRAALPAPSAASFFSVLTGDEELTEISSRNKKLFPSIGLILSASAFFRRPLMTAWGSAALILVLGLPILYWLSMTKNSGSNTEIAQAFEHENKLPVFEPEKNENFAPLDAPAEQTSVSKPENRRAAPSSAVKPPARKDSPRFTDRRATLKNSAGISSVRGVTAPCSNLWKIESSLTANAAKIVFRWEKVSRAAKYHLYIFDDNEILIDEFETERATEYSLDKSIDPKKTYKWKIVVTLENGETIVGDSRIIKSGDPAAQLSNRKMAKGKTADVRCAVNSNE